MNRSSLLIFALLASASAAVWADSPTAPQPNPPAAPAPSTPTPPPAPAAPTVTLPRPSSQPNVQREDPNASLPPTQKFGGWDVKFQGEFVTALTQAPHGLLWVGTEDNGIWRYDPAAAENQRWTGFTAKDGLGDLDTYGMACDARGRVWAGHLNHGVSVYNDGAWKNYGITNGPLGDRVFAIAANPVDSDIWIATNAGLSRFSDRSGWSYFTRADGLPSDQASALSFNQQGTLFLGTQCDGIAIASPADNYRSWRLVRGPASMPVSPAGAGLPSSLVNSVLCTRDGSVYVGTPCGLAHSSDGGSTWTYLRGADWAAKVQGQYAGGQPVPTAVAGDLLLEDYVTCMAEDNAGLLWIGHRRTPAEVMDPETGRRVMKIPVTRNCVSTILPLPGGSVLIGAYGGGLEQSRPPLAMSGSPAMSGRPAMLQRRAQPASTSVPQDEGAALFPQPAAASSPSDLAGMSRYIASHKDPLPVGAGLFIGDDWATRGDWVGRYGRQYAVLCGASSPYNHYLVSDDSFAIHSDVGPHHAFQDGLRCYVSRPSTNDPDTLYDPLVGCRRQAEWYDHGDAHPTSFEGPDIWLTVEAPRGVHRLSVYFFNNDGHSNGTRDRDFLLQLKAYTPDLAAAETEPELARARVSQFWHGVYKQFAVRGPAKFYLKIARDGSYNTKCSAVFLDLLYGPYDPLHDFSNTWYGGVHYAPPAVPAATRATSNERLQGAQALWSLLNDTGDQRASYSVRWAYRVLAYRAALASGSASGLLDNWSWTLRLWSDEDRKSFADAMSGIWRSVVEQYPSLQGK